MMLSTAHYTQLSYQQQHEIVTRLVAELADTHPMVADMQAILSISSQPQQQTLDTLYHIIAELLAIAKSQDMDMQHKHMSRLQQQIRTLHDREQQERDHEDPDALLDIID